MTYNQYKSDLETSLMVVSYLIGNVEANVTDEFDTINYAEVLLNLNILQQRVKRLLSAHKFLKVSEEEFSMMFEGKTNRSIEIIHNVTGYDSLMSIAKKYNITEEQILQKNNVLSSEIIAGMQLVVEVESSKGLNKIYEQIAVYGSQIGTEILGTDLPNELVENGVGDLKILTNEETVSQGVQNRIYTKAGDYPLEPNFGIELAGSEIPADLMNGMLMLKIVDQLENDLRISDVESLEIEKAGNALIITAAVRTINNQILEIK
ncbi:MAG: LysM peptidoglycan-binding domain-containing protein [Ignavibacteriaceae bacterium]|nr:LysM peptidoglycan-binding domain-containing protein [Ignavibacteriaceae bacterium]